MEANTDWKRECVAVIPCLNEAVEISSVVTGIRGMFDSVVVVDDGSTDSTARCATSAGARVIRHEVNRGKGAALMSGLGDAQAGGFKWALIMDGDGQHSPDDIPALLKSAVESGADMVVGNRMHEALRMPLIRRGTNRFMSGLLSWMSGYDLPDSQCGFRLVSLEAWRCVQLQSARFEVESEMLVDFLAAGRTVAFAPVQAIYKDELSKIQPVRDSMRWMRWLWRSRSALRTARTLRK